MQERTYFVEFVCVDCGQTRTMKLETVRGKEIDRGCLCGIVCTECDDLAKAKSAKKWKEEKALDRLEKSGFPIGKVSAWCYGDAKRNKALEEWIWTNRNEALWIAGYPQIGKTFAALRCAMDESEKGRLVRWTQGNDLFGGYVDALRESSAKASAYIRGFLSCDLLVVDDIDDPGRFTFTAGQLMYKLLDGIKNDRAKRIWITCNILKGELRGMFESDNHGAKVEERLRDRFRVWGGAPAAPGGELNK